MLSKLERNADLARTWLSSFDAPLLPHPSELGLPWKFRSPWHACAKSSKVVKASVSHADRNGRSLINVPGEKKMPHPILVWTSQFFVSWNNVWSMRSKASSLICSSKKLSLVCIQTQEFQLLSSSLLSICKNYYMNWRNKNAIRFTITIAIAISRLSGLSFLAIRLFRGEWASNQRKPELTISRSE